MALDNEKRMAKTDFMKSSSFLAYDTLCTVSIDETELAGAAAFTACFAAAEAKAMQVEETLSMFDASSELSRLCAGYTPNVPVKVSGMLLDFICLNLGFAEKTGGAFDSAVGPLVKLWGFLADEPRVPADDEIDAMLARGGSLGARRCAIRMTRPVSLARCRLKTVVSPRRRGTSMASKRTA